MRSDAFIATAIIALGLTAAVGAELPVKNMAFQEWDAAKNMPAQWGGPVGNGTFSFARDCENPVPGRCVLRVTREMATGFVPLAQSIPSSAVGGYRLKLSGLVRTRDVSGWAGLWMRVDSGTAMVSMDNMSDRGPRGTSDWKRFELVQPVPANTTRVVYGILLSGAGTAWFDDLRMEVDTNEKVADYVEPNVAPVARPVPPPNLLEDEALALAPSDIPAIKAPWREDALARAIPIRSLVSDDFSDLQFLKPLLAGKRVVQLGESAHGVAEFNWLKTRLVKFLHRELGYDVIAFESSMSGCDIADGHVGTIAAVEVMRDCIFPVWHSAETVQLFEYLGEARKSDKPLTLAGFDTQNSSNRGSAPVSARLLAMVDDPALAVRVRAAEDLLSNAAGRLGDEESARLVGTYGDLERHLLQREASLRRSASRPIEVDFAIQEARSRGQFTRQKTGKPGGETMLIRDRGMADNLDFLLDKAYPGRKIIVWAHNYHVAKEQFGAPAPKAMGGWVAQRRGAEVYTIGLFMGRGVAALNDRKPYEIAPPSADTMEAILANAGRRMSFVDFSRAQRTEGAEWIFGPTQAREWGKAPMTLVPSRSFDAVIYIDAVTPPAFL